MIYFMQDYDLNYKVLASFWKAVLDDSIGRENSENNAKSASSFRDSLYFDIDGYDLDKKDAVSSESSFASSKSAYLNASISNVSLDSGISTSAEDAVFHYPR
jgi:hypothetical protein